MIAPGYAELVAIHPAHLTLKLDTDQPIELEDFVGSFTALASQFDRFVRATQPDLASETQIFVKEVRAGCIEADLIPALAWMAPFISDMDKALIVEDFVRRYGARLGRFFHVGGRDEEATRSDLKDFHRTVSGIAKDPEASARIEAAVFEDGKREIRSAFTFTSAQAQVAVREIEEQRRLIDHESAPDHQRVLMRFTRSDVHGATLQKRSGERVVIEEVSPKDMPLIYASELAEQRIKHEIREADENVFKKGFVVDANPQLSGGRTVAYRVTNVHQVIDLPED